MATPKKGSAPVNQLPASQRMLEDQRLLLTGLRLVDSDAADSTLTITLSVTQGSLQVGSDIALSYSPDGRSVTLTGSLSQLNAALGAVTFTPPSGFAGTVTLTMTSSDLGNTSDEAQTDTDTLAITVQAVNDAPTASDRVVTTPEDRALVFKAADFGFSDSDGHVLAAVRITSLPGEGRLIYKGKTVTAQQIAQGFEVSAADLAAGRLTFAPAKDAHGEAYTQFLFQVRDTGGRTNGGQDTSAVHALTVQVTPVNDGPVAGNDSAFASPVSSAQGRVLNNDSDVEGDRLSVTGVALGAESTKTQTLQTVTSTSQGTTLTGKYGTLTIAADGSYRYEVNANSVAYRALKGGSATESFTYEISDGQGGTDKATLAIKVTAPNQGPVARDDSSVVPSNTVSSKVLSNDSDADKDKLIVTGVATGTEHHNEGRALQPITAKALNGIYGRLTLRDDGSYSYIVDTKGAAYIALGKDVTGTDSFTYEISDGRGGFDRATLNIAVKGVNDATVANEDVGYALNPYDSYDDEANVLFNDSDLDVSDRDRLVVSKVGAGIQVSQLVLNVEGMPETVINGQYGQLSMRADGYYTYRTDPSKAAFQALPHEGTYSEVFSYEVIDGRGGSSKAQITVYFPGPSAVPEAHDDTATSGRVLDNDRDADGDDLRVFSAGVGSEAENAGNSLTAVPTISGGSGLTLTGTYGTLNIAQDGHYVYTLSATDPDYRALSQNTSATDSFTYEITDGTTGDRATIKIAVTGINDAPDATNDTTLLGKLDTSASGNVLTNDSDVDSGETATLKVTGLSTTTGSTSTNTNTGSLLLGLIPVSSTSPVPTTPTVINPLPTSSTSSVTIPTGSTGASLTGTYGTLTLKADGSYSYALDANDADYRMLLEDQTATDTFTYTITDAQGATDTATLKVTVTGNNNPPVANDDTGAQTLTVGNVGASQAAVLTTSGNVITNSDTDANIDTLSVSKAGKGKESDTPTLTALSDHDSNATTAQQITLEGTYGSLVLKADGSYTYSLGASDADYVALAKDVTATESFTYEVSDGKGGTDKATLSLKVQGINDAPVGVNDSATLLGERVIAPVDITTSRGTVGGGETNLQVTLKAGHSYTFSHPSGSTENFFVLYAGQEQLSVGQTFPGNLVQYTYTNTSDTDIQAVMTVKTRPNNVPLTQRETFAGETLLAQTGKTGNVLTNDTDADTGDQALLKVTKAGAGTETGNQAATLTVLADSDSNAATPSTLTVQGRYGSLVINADGSYSYSINRESESYQALAKDVTADDVFTYEVSDGKGGVDKAKLTLTVTGVNDAPVAVDDSAELKPARQEARGEVVTTLPASLSHNRSLSLEGGKTYTFTATASDAIYFSISDNAGYSDGVVSKSISFELTVPGTGPKTYNVSANTTSSSPFSLSYSTSSEPVDEPAELSKSGNVLTNDTDVDTGDKALLKVTQAGAGSKDDEGTLSALVVPSTPETDGGSTSSSNTTTTGSTPTATLTVQGTYGELVINADGSYTYTLDSDGENYRALAAGSTPTDNFTYVVADPSGGSDTATLAITVNGINDAPDADDDIVTDVLSSASATLTTQRISFGADVASRVQPSEDELVAAYWYALPTHLGASHSFTVSSDSLIDVALVAGKANDPDAPPRLIARGQDGVVSFTNHGELLPGETLSLVVFGGSEFTVSATQELFTVAPVTGDVLDNDNDIDTGDTLTVTGVRTGEEASATTTTTTTTTDAPTLTPVPAGSEGITLEGTYGTLTLKADGSYGYALNPIDADYLALTGNDVVTESFTYEVSDSHGAKDQATLQFTVAGRNDAPVAVDDASTATLVSQPITADRVLARDTYPAEEDVLVAVVTLQPGQTYTLQVSSNVTDTFQWVVVNSEDNSTPLLVETTEQSSTSAIFHYTHQGDAPITIVMLVYPSGDDTTLSATGSLSEPVDLPTLTQLEGWVLTNDADVDTGDQATLTVTRARAGAESDAMPPAFSSLTANDPNDNQPASVTLIGQYGTLILNADGSYHYSLATNGEGYAALAAGEFANDHFTYVVTDSSGASDTATLAIEVVGINDAPVAENDINATVLSAADAVQTTTLSTLIAADAAAIEMDSGDNYYIFPLTTSVGATHSFTASGNAMEVGFYADKANGEFRELHIVSGANSTATYTNSTGLEPDEYLVLAVLVEGGETPAFSLAGTTTQFAVPAATGNVLNNDNDPDTGDVLAVTPGTLTGTYGTLTLSANGSYSYALNITDPDYIALGKDDSVTESFTYIVSDGKGGSDSAMLSLTVQGINDAPVGEDDSAALAPARLQDATETAEAFVQPAETSKTGNVLTNDTDVDTGEQATLQVTNAALGAEGSSPAATLTALADHDSDAATAAQVTLTGQHGTLVLQANGSYTYTLNANDPDYAALGLNETLTDSFTYVVSDGSGGSDTATLTVSSQRAQAEPVLITGNLNGENGFKVSGVAADDNTGRSVSGAGDLNNDGYDDFIVGAYKADTNGLLDTGAAFVVFGSSSLGSPTAVANLNLSDLTGSNGFRLNGLSADDKLGSSVSKAGDVNGDGFDDLIVGANSVDAIGKSNAGASYVLFGGSAMAPSGELALMSLNGSNGFRLTGTAASQERGRGVSAAGDVNGDGYDDLILAGAGTNPALVVLGGRSVGASGELALSPDTVFTLKLGGSTAVSGAGDVNGDGYDDLLVSLVPAKALPSAYLVFGGNDLLPAGSVTLGTTSTSDYLVIGGIANSFFGNSVASAGDVNGDGYADLIIGAQNSKSAHVVFGSNSAPVAGSKLHASSLNGSNGFVLNASNSLSNFGVSVSSAGDFNGDGYDDLIVGDGAANKASIVFGGASMAASLNVSALNGLNGFTWIPSDGDAGGFGGSVSSAGDLNGDGFDDLIVGAVRAGVNGSSNAGAAYIIYGFATGNTGAATNALLTGTTASEALNGGLGNDRLDGGLGNDVLIGGAGNDTLVYDAADTLRVDGGTGRDTLAITGSGVVLDLTALNSFGETVAAPANPYSNIEIIDLTGSGNNRLSLSPLDLLRLTGAATGSDGARDNHLLRVDGNTGDTVALFPGLWTPAGFANGDGTLVSDGGYTLYTSGQARLLVANAVAVVEPNIAPVAVDDKATLGLLGASEVLSENQPFLGSGSMVAAVGTYSSTITLQPGREYQFAMSGGGGPGAAANFTLRAGSETLIATVGIGAGGQVFSYTHLGNEPLEAIGVVEVTGNGFGYSVTVSELQPYTATELEKSGHVLTNDTDANTADVLTVTQARMGAEGSTPAGSFVMLADHDDSASTLNQATLTGTYGSLVLKADGSYTYTLNNEGEAYLALGDATAIDHFTYVAHDGNGGSDAATLAIKVNGANDAPTVDAALSVAITEGEGGTSTVVSSLENLVAGQPVIVQVVLTGDSGDPLLEIVDNTDMVVATDDNNGPGAFGSRLIFVPEAGKTYSARVTDAGNTLSGNAYTLSVESVPAAQQINLLAGARDNESATLAVRLETLRIDVKVQSEDGPVDFATLAEVAGIGERLVATSYYDAHTGLLVLDAAGKGFDFALGGKSYALVLSYDISDGELTVPQTLTVNITGVNDAPLASDDTASVTPGSVDVSSEPRQDGGPLGVLANDSDADFHETATLVVNQPGTLKGTYGNLILSADGSYRYELDVTAVNYLTLLPGATGIDSFIYHVSDASGATDTATLRVSVTGGNGVALQGVAAFDNTGRSVSDAGDVNGDGFADVIVGARRADANGVSNSGASYVVFGGSTSDVRLALSSLDGRTGFKLSGEGSYDYSGVSVSSAGDLNGDGYDDLIVGANGADANGINAGASYVVFGGTSVGTAGNLNLSALNGSNGFKISGVASFDEHGISVSNAGDVNGDGFADLIIGAYRADPYGSDSGASYVVFGGSSLGSTSHLNLSALDGSNGFMLSGVAQQDYSGRSVSSAGDVNGDGYDDLIVGTNRADANSINAGASYVVFGGSSVGTAGNLNLSDLTGSNGFKLSGQAAYDESGRSVSSAGDLNGDGFDDLLVGANRADPNGSDSGASYVVFGGSSVGATGNINLSALNGANGFQLSGVAARDNSGISVSSAGDVNGDGFADLIIGANGVDTDDNGEDQGASYVLFGSSSLSTLANLNLSMLSGTTGFKLSGIESYDYSGISVSSAGDVNGDGFDDLLVGASNAKAAGISYAGASYIVYGFATGEAITQSFIGSEQDETFIGGFGNDFFDGGSGNDVMIGGAGNDTFAYQGEDTLRVDGGNGRDTLRITNDGVTLDLTGLNNFKDPVHAPASPYENIEIIDLSGSSDAMASGNTLRLNKADLLRLVGSATGDDFLRDNNLLRVDGNDGDRVELTSGTWRDAGHADGDGNVQVSGGYTLYTNGEARLLVANAVTVELPPEQTPPVAHEDVGAQTLTAGNNGVLATRGNVLANDTDINLDDILRVTDLRTGAENAGGELDPVGSDGASFAGTFGSLFMAANGRYTYTLNATDPDYRALAQGSEASEVFTYAISDGQGGTDTATLTLTVQGINNAPVAGNDSASLAAAQGETPAETVKIGNVLTNDTDPDTGEKDTLQVSGVRTGLESAVNPASLTTVPGGLTGTTLIGSFGSLQLKADGSYTYTLDASSSAYTALSEGVTGTDSFTYEITDAQGAKDKATLSVVVTGNATVYPPVVVTPQPVIQLASLDGEVGYKMSNNFKNGLFGEALTSGDFNGDGFDDMVISRANSSLINEKFAYVVFGSADGHATANLDITKVTPSQGFAVTSSSSLLTMAEAIAAADVNGDGFDDLIMGFVNKGVYVVFGGSNLGNVSLDSLNGTNGFIRTFTSSAANMAKRIASAGDVNGDGFEDITVTNSSSAIDASNLNAGRAYVIYGSANPSHNVSLTANATSTNGTGFQVVGLVNQQLGHSGLSGAGDLNGDGFDDVVVGTITTSGERSSYVVFGGNNIANLSVSELNGSKGFELQGTSGPGFPRQPRSAGDLNGDGYDDLLIGSSDSKVYVMFGAANIGSTGSVTADSLTGSKGFVVTGVSGYSEPQSPGDINGDGFDDLLLTGGAPVNGAAGDSYVIFGGTNLASIAVSDLNGVNGFKLQGVVNDQAGDLITMAGDVNGDGFDDLLVGAFADDGLASNAGAAYIVYGFAAGNVDALRIGGDGNDRMIGNSGKNQYIGGLGNDYLDGAGGDDILIGGAGNDTLVYDAADTLKVDGGNGRDILAILGSDVTLDLTALNNFATVATAPTNPLDNIEIIDLTGTGNNTLKLNALDLFELVGSATGSDGLRDNNLLRVDGNAGDKVQFTSGTWTNAGTFNGDGAAGTGYTLYTNGQADLLVATLITVENAIPMS